MRSQPFGSRAVRPQSFSAKSMTPLTRGEKIGLTSLLAGGAAFTYLALRNPPPVCPAPQKLTCQ